LFNGLALVLPSGNPKDSKVNNAKGTARTLIAEGIHIAKLYMSSAKKKGPQSSAKYRPGIAFQPN